MTASGGLSTHRPYPVGMAKAVGVGDEQYASCKSCANFGCAVSAVAGSYGTVAESLCFDAQCHSKKVLDRASGKLSFWDRQRTLRAGRQPDRRWWPAFFLSCAIFGFLWAITLLSYLLPPREIWGNLVGGTLTPNQARFIAIGSVVFTLEFMFARHLFCRFGCAVGLFQSLAWMANPRSLVVAFDRRRATACRASAAGSASSRATARSSALRSDAAVAHDA